MRIIVACIAIALCPSTAHPGTPTEWVFDGSVPPGVTFQRSTSRLNESGNTVPAGMPVFSTRAVIDQGATLIAELDPSQTVLAVEQVGPQVYTLVREFNRVFLTPDTPGLTIPLNRIDPDPANNAKFGIDTEWGQPASAEIYPDGTILIHTSGTSPENRSKTIRTSVATFDQQPGMALVRTSDYLPPPGTGTTSSPSWFTRTTYLPNLDTHVSAVVEYKSAGLESTTYPGDGRAIGYASTDAGLTWQRVIDTDDPLLGRNLVVTAKHLHHLEPFEWWDDEPQQWNIGVIACLGDEVTSSGPIFVFSNAPSFPDPDSGQYPTLERRKAVGRDMLTDTFPLDPSLSPGDPLVYLLGQDTSQAGIIEATIDEIEQTDRIIWRPVTSFYRRTDQVSSLTNAPFIFQLGRLSTGCFVAPTTEARPVISPNGFLVSDPTGQHWCTARQTDTTGYSGMIPASSDMFWTVDRGALPQVSQLWQIQTPQLENPLLLSGAASSVTPLSLLANNPSITTTDATGTITLPDELPASTTIQRMQSKFHTLATRIDTQSIYPVSALPGQLVSLVTWIKPARLDLDLANLDFDPVIHTGANASSTHTSRYAPDANAWTRIVISRIVPPAGITGIEFQITPTPGSFVSRPLDYYFTEPQLIVSDQPLVQALQTNQPTAADFVSLDLPPLGAEWSVQIDCTEELAFACSLTNNLNQDITVVDTSTIDTYWQGIRSQLQLSPNIDATPRFPLESEPHDIFLPTLSRITIVMSQPNDVVKLYVQRGMGDVDGRAMPDIPFTPTTLQLATPDQSRVMQGTLHRIRVWPNTALDLGPSPFIDQCPNDANADGSVDVNDISYILFRLGNTGDPETLEGDVNSDGVVDVNDVSGVLFNLGPCPTP